MQTKHLFLLPAFAFFFCADLQAQVVIGSVADEPANGALLDLNSPTGNKGGLLLSNVTIADLDLIPIGNPDIFPGITPATADVNPDLQGAMVYNDGKNPAVPAGIYIWNGYCWTNDGRFNLSCLPAGTGNFGGKTRFDIAYTDGDGTNACGTAASRTSQKTDFSLTTPQNGLIGGLAPGFTFSGVQVYTFTPTANVSRVRFGYIDESGLVIDRIVPEQSSYATGNNISSARVTVYYRASLNTDLRGLTRDNALKVKLYVVYNSDATYGSATNDKSVDLTVTLQDCHSCGASTAAGWLNFLCHNLGADESLDPFTWNSGGDNVDADIKGSLYQWGRYTDGHEVRSTAHATSGRPTIAQYNAAVSNYKSFDTPISYNQFYTEKNTSTDDWVDDADPNTTAGKSRWGDGTTDTNPAKAPNDPCPAGWKVPSSLQWRSIFRTDPSEISDSNIIYGIGSATANTWTSTGTWSTSGTTRGGYMVGDALYLPAAGLRRYDTGLMQGIGDTGYYWSSTWHNYYTSSNLYFYNGGMSPSFQRRASGCSVRCVAE